MTPTEKQKCIAEQAVYRNLKVIANNQLNCNSVCCVNNEHVSLRYANGEIPCFHTDKVKPILRPLSDLTKEITHKGYNDDKPFTPLVECGRLNALPVYNTERALRYYDLLYQWHFDTRNLISKGEAINVNTLDVNPYSVQQ